MTTPTIEVRCCKCGQPLLIPKPSSAVTVKCPKCETPLQISRDGKVRRRSENDFSHVPAAEVPTQAPRRAKGFTADQPPAKPQTPPASQPGRVYMPLKVGTQRVTQTGPLIRSLIGLSVAVVCMIGLAVVAIRFIPDDLPQRIGESPLAKRLPIDLMPSTSQNPESSGSGASANRSPKALLPSTSNKANAAFNKVMDLLRQADQLREQGLGKLPTAKGGSDYSIQNSTSSEIIELWNRSRELSKRAQQSFEFLLPLSEQEYANFEQTVSSMSVSEDKILNGNSWRTTYPALRNPWYECDGEFNFAVAALRDKLRPTTVPIGQESTTTH